MGRIRTIKPEFPQSETIGRLSRDARLLFIQLWTIVDDSGRARASSRMLASLLYPYDDDARDLIISWLDELEEKECIRRYEVDGSQYLDIPKWLNHQKIEKPSASKLPSFDDMSPNSRRIVAEASPTDLGSGSRIKDKDLSSLRSDSAKPEKPAKPDPKGTRLEATWVPDNHDLTMAVDLIGNEAVREQILQFRDYWFAKPGKDGRKLDWGATWRNWVRRAADNAKVRSPARGGGFATLHASLTERLGK